MSNRFQKFLSGFFASIAGTIVLQLITLIVTPIYLVLTSQEVYGMWLILLSIFGWLQFGDMGIGMALTRKSVESIEKKDYIDLNKFLYSSILSFTLIGLFFLIIGLFLKNYIVDFFNIDFENSKDFLNTYIVLLLIGFLSPISKVFASIIEAHQRIDFLKISGTIISIVSIVFTLVFLKNDFGIISFALGLSIKLILTPIVELIFLKKIDLLFSLFPVVSSKKHFLSLLSFGGKFQILKIANMISSSADIIIIGAYLGAAYASIYTFTSKLAFIFSIGFISLLPTVLFPGLSQLFVQNDLKKLRKIYLSLLKLSLRLGIFISIIYYCLNESFVSIWVGNENYGGDNLTNIFIIWILIESTIRGITAIIYASGKLNKLTIYTCIEAILNVLFTIYLINYFSLIGVALGTIFSRSITLIFIPLYINNILNVNYKKIYDSLVYVVLYSIPTIAIAIFLKKYIIDIFSSVYFVIICGLLLTITNFLFFEFLYFIRIESKKGIRDKLKQLKEYYFS